MEEYFKQWLVGFTDGEGCFGLSIRKRPISIKNGTFYFSKDIVFQIALRDDDREIIEKIHDNLKCGKISYSVPRNKWKLKEYISHGMVQFRVASIKEIANIIIPIFDKYPLLTKKRRDYDIWRKAVLFCYSKHKMKGANQFVKRYSEQDEEYLLNLRQELRETKKYVKKT